MVKLAYIPQTVLALRGSGGIKARKRVPPARALRAHGFFDSRWVFSIKRKKKTPVAAVWRSPPSRDCSESNIFFSFDGKTAARITEKMILEARGREQLFEPFIPPEPLRGKLC